MSLPVEARQSRSRQEANSKMQREREPSVKKEEPIVPIMEGVAKGIVDGVSNVVGKIWPNSEAQTTTVKPTVKPTPLFNDVMVDVDGMIVYDQPTEDGFVEVAFASQVRTTPRKQQPSLAEDIGAKPPASLPITMPKSPKKSDKDQGKYRPFM